MQCRIFARDPLMRFFALTLARADASFRAPRPERRERFFLSR
jgi:hypothetical protein